MAKHFELILMFLVTVTGCSQLQAHHNLKGPYALSDDHVRLPSHRRTFILGGIARGLGRIGAGAAAGAAASLGLGGGMGVSGGANARVSGGVGAGGRIGVSGGMRGDGVVNLRQQSPGIVYEYPAVGYAHPPYRYISPAVGYHQPIGGHVQNADLQPCAQCQCYDQ